MPKFFYKDCVVSDLQRVDPKSDVFTALIDGRKIPRLAMDNRVFHYLIGPGKDTKSRIWFHAPGFNKGLVIAGAGGNADGSHVERNMTLNTQYRLMTRPIIAGILAWFAAWVVLIVPVLNLYSVTPSKGMELLGIVSVAFGCGVGALFLGKALWVVHKTNTLERWRAGSTDRYTEELPTPPSASAAKPKAAAKAAPELVD